MRERLKIFGPAGLMTLLGFIAAYQYIGSAPSDTVVAIAGEPEGAYYQFARLTSNQPRLRF